MEKCRKMWKHMENVKDVENILANLEKKEENCRTCHGNPHKNSPRFPIGPEVQAAPGTYISSLRAQDPSNIFNDAVFKDALKMGIFCCQVRFPEATFFNQLSSSMAITVFADGSPC